jgi:hypothetical protein
MLDIVNVRQPGRPYVFSHECEYAGQLIIKGGWQMRHRESDGIIVPMKAGNAAGGKDAT